MRPPRRFVRFVRLAACAALALAPAAARADGLGPGERERLERGEVVVRPQSLETERRTMVGGVAYALVEASETELIDLVSTPEELARLLPRTRSVRPLPRPPTQGAALRFEITQGQGPLAIRYAVSMLVDREHQEVRFWVDPSAPHDIDDAWGFVRWKVVPGATPRLLVTYAALVDVGPGLFRGMLEAKVTRALTGMPHALGRRVAALRAR